MNLSSLIRSLALFLQAHVTNITLKIALKALNVPDNVSNITCSYLFASGTGLCNSYKTLTFLSIHFINALSYNRYIQYHVLHVHTLFLNICMAVMDYAGI